MSKYEIVPTNKFKKDLKMAIKRGYNMTLIEEVIDILAKGEQLPEKYKETLPDADSLKRLLD